MLTANIDDKRQTADDERRKRVAYNFRRIMALRGLRGKDVALMGQVDVS